MEISAWDSNLYFMTIWAATWQNQQNGCAPSEDSDQPGNPPSLIRVFAVCMKKAWVLIYPLSAQRRVWSDWADAQADLSLCWAHTFCWFCHVVAHIFTALLIFFVNFCGISKLSVKGDHNYIISDVRRSCDEKNPASWITRGLCNGWMPRLIWVFVGRTCHFVGFVLLRLI